jgi:hypothetical protein
MKLRYGFSCVMLALVVLSLGNRPLLAQDVAAAARANRASHNGAAPVNSVNTVSEAQEPVDALRTCVTDNTSGKDRKDLAKWVFFAMATHPEIRQYADAKVAAAADESSQTLAALVTRLLTDSCANEFRGVIKTGQGSQALRLAFETLGQLAMQELMADKTVRDAMGSFAHYVDQARLNGLLAGN